MIGVRRAKPSVISLAVGIEHIVAVDADTARGIYPMRVVSVIMVRRDS